MATATFNKFQFFVEDVGKGIHNYPTHIVTVALMAAAPAAANHVLADIAQISYTNLSTRAITPTSYAQTSGTARLILPDLTLTASGAVATFRYVVIYNSTAAAGNLIGWWDYGSNVTMANTETFKLDFDNVNGVITIA